MPRWVMVVVRVSGNCLLILNFLGQIKSGSSTENEDRWKEITDLRREKGLWSNHLRKSTEEFACQAILRDRELDLIRVRILPIDYAEVSCCIVLALSILLAKPAIQNCLTWMELWGEWKINFYFVKPLSFGVTFCYKS